MSTGTIQDAAPLIITDMKSDVLQLGFTNDSGETLTPGQEVTLKTAGTIDIRDAGSDIPLGIVIKGGADGTRVTIRTYFTAVIKGKIVDSGINAGQLVVPNGSKDSTTNIPEFVAGTSSDYAVGMALNAASEDGAITIGILDGIVSGNDHAYASQELAAYVNDDESAAYTGTEEMYVYLQNIATATTTGGIAQEDISASGATWEGGTIAQPDVPRNVVLTVTDGDTSITAGTITVTGLDQGGVEVSEVFDVTDGLVQTGDVVFAKITAVAGADFAGNGAGDTVDMGYGVKIGLPNGKKGGLSITKLVANGTEQATSVTVDTTNGSYTSSTAPDGSNDYEIWYKVNSSYLTNVNALRTAYENLEAYVSDIAAKLVTAGILTTP